MSGVVIYPDNFTREFDFPPEHWDKSIARSKKIILHFDREISIY